MKKSNYREKRIIIFAVFVLIITTIILPLSLKIPFIKQILMFLLDFTSNEAYKVAFVEFVGAIIGAFIAICGSVWIQAKEDAKEEKSNVERYAFIVYNDLYLAFNDLIKMFRDTKIRHNLENINGLENVKLFSEVALGRKIHLSPNWISDVAQLKKVLSKQELQAIYKYYGKLIEIDSALQSGDVTEIEKIYSTHIGYLVSGNERKIHSDCKIILDKLFSLTGLEPNIKINNK